MNLKWASSQTLRSKLCLFPLASYVLVHGHDLRMPLLTFIKETGISCAMLVPWIVSSFGEYKQKDTISEFKSVLIASINSD